MPLNPTWSSWTSSSASSRCSARKARSGMPRGSGAGAVPGQGARRQTRAHASAFRDALQAHTADAEIEHEEHYEDFLATTRFLLLGGDEARVRELQQQLAHFGAALRRAAAGDPEQVERVKRSKRAVEGSLQDVMARTERVAASDDRDAMVAEKRRTTTVTGRRRAAVPVRRCAVSRRWEPGPDAVLEVGPLPCALHARLSVQRAPRRGDPRAGQDGRCARAPRLGVSEGGGAAVVGAASPPGTPSCASSWAS